MRPSRTKKRKKKNSNMKMEEALQSNRDCLVRDIQSKRLASYFIITVFSANIVPFQPHFNPTVINRK